MLVGDADHAGDDDAGQDRGELVLQLALAALGDRRTQLTGSLADETFDRGNPLGRECARDEGPHGRVPRRIEVDHLRQQALCLFDEARERVVIVHGPPHVLETRQRVGARDRMAIDGIVVAQRAVDIPQVVLELSRRRVVDEPGRRCCHDGVPPGAH